MELLTISDANLASLNTSANVTAGEKVTSKDNNISRQALTDAALYLTMMNEFFQ